MARAEQVWRCRARLTGCGVGVGVPVVAGVRRRAAVKRTATEMQGNKLRRNSDPR